jgi:hypothetical protein
VSKQGGGLFAPMTEEVTEDWRKKHNENLHNVYFSPKMINVMKLKSRTWGFV